MNFKLKEIIAREFLILIAVATVGLFSFFCTYPYNWIKSNQVKNAEEKIIIQTRLVDSLSQPFRAKTITDDGRFFGSDYTSRVYLAIKTKKYDANNIKNLRVKEFILSELDFRKEIISDRIFRDNVYQFLVEQVEGFNRTQFFFDSAVNSQLTSNDIKQEKQAQIIRQNLIVTRTEKDKASSSILKFDEQVSFGIKTLITSIFLLFAVRYLFYAIKWSLIILKQKSK